MTTIEQSLVLAAVRAERRRDAAEKEAAASVDRLRRCQEGFEHAWECLDEAAKDRYPESVADYGENDRERLGVVDALSGYPDGTPGLRFVVPGLYTQASTGPDGRTWYSTWQEAVEAARQTIRPIVGGGATRAFVDLRQSVTWADPDTSVGTDKTLIRWEVFVDRVLFTEGDSAAGDAEKTLNMTAPKRGMA